MSSSECGSSSSDEECDPSVSRKFEISKMILRCLDPASESLSRQWTFVMDDGLFERQANFCTKRDLWRHLERIDVAMSKLTKKAKKGTARLYWADSAQEWTRQSSQASKWVIRFSRKFPVNLADFWVKLALLVLAGSMPHTELVLGCVYTTKKGKSEMEIFVPDVPTDFDDEDDSFMRDWLGVDRKERTIQFTYKSQRAIQQKQADLARINHVKQKQKGHTWPLIAKGSEEDPEEELAAFKKELHNSHTHDDKVSAKFQYTFDVPHSFPVDIPVAPKPALSLEKLQELQLEQLKICPSSDSDGEKPVKEELEPMQFVLPARREAHKETKPFLDSPPPPVSFHVTPRKECGELERTNYGFHVLDSPVELQKTNVKACSPPTFVLGTNPPDLSSPVMKATLARVKFSFSSSSARPPKQRSFSL